jgi:hypothetical protein
MRSFQSNRQSPIAHMNLGALGFPDNSTLVTLMEIDENHRVIVTDEPFVFNSPEYHDHRRKRHRKQKPQHFVRKLRILWRERSSPCLTIAEDLGDYDVTICAMNRERKRTAPEAIAASDSFESTWVQSEMRIKHFPALASHSEDLNRIPDTSFLCLNYHRLMACAALAYAPPTLLESLPFTGPVATVTAPCRILSLGLGAGCLPSFFLLSTDAVRCTSVEISVHVAVCARRHFDCQCKIVPLDQLVNEITSKEELEEEPNLVLIGDALNFITSAKFSTLTWDIIFVDISSDPLVVACEHVAEGLTSSCPFTAPPCQFLSSQILSRLAQSVRSSVGVVIFNVICASETHLHNLIQHLSTLFRVMDVVFDNTGDQIEFHVRNHIVICRPSSQNALQPWATNYPNKSDTPNRCNDDENEPSGFIARVVRNCFGKDVDHSNDHKDVRLQELIKCTRIGNE